MAEFFSSAAPFPAPSALNTERLCGCPNSKISSGEPVSSLNDPDKSLTYVPGEPSVHLNATEIHAFLTRELDTPLLDELHIRLWLVARRSGRSIDPLHKQRVRGRDIVPTENPKLHMVWDYNKIFLKPVPVCLLNYDFWTAFLPWLVDGTSSTSSVPQDKENRLAEGFDTSIAVGFLRSYAFLIQHELDFILAKEFHLIPADLEWIKWSIFIANFRRIDDDRVAKRYQYGQLRMSRLNWVVRIFQPHSAQTVWFYELPHWSTNWYMERAAAPLIFAFASLSLVLSSMQVALSVPDDGLGLGLGASEIMATRQAFWIFSIAVLFFSGIIWVLLLVIPLSVISLQLLWGFRNREMRNGKGPNAA